MNIDNRGLWAAKKNGRSWARRLYYFSNTNGERIAAADTSETVDISFGSRDYIARSGGKTAGGIASSYVIEELLVQIDDAASVPAPFQNRRKAQNTKLGLAGNCLDRKAAEFLRILELGGRWRRDQAHVHGGVQSSFSVSINGIGADEDRVICFEHWLRNLLKSLIKSGPYLLFQSLPFWARLANLDLNVVSYPGPTW